MYGAKEGLVDRVDKRTCSRLRGGPQKEVSLYGNLGEIGLNVEVYAPHCFMTPCCSIWAREGYKLTVIAVYYHHDGDVPHCLMTK